MAEANKEKQGMRWSDPQFYKQRFILALFPCALLAFIYCFFGPLDLLYSNRGELGISLRNAFPVFLCAFLVLTAALSALLALLRGKGYKAALCAVFALAVVSYVQGSFLNGGMQLLDGADFDVDANRGKIVVNSILCFTVLLAAFLLPWLLREKGMPVLCALCGALMLMQSTALVGSFIKDAKEDRRSFVFSETDSSRISSNKNTVVFLLDAFSNYSMQGMLEAYPNALDSFHDFTYYTNCVSDYYSTFPSMIHILTGAQYDPEGTWQDFVDNAWKSPRANDFFGTLKAQGYSVDIYAPYSNYYAETRDQLEDKVDNTVRIHRETEPISLLTSMERLALCRYLPLAFKQYVWCAPEDFADISTVVDDKGEKVKTWSWAGYQFFRDRLAKDGLAANEENNCFKLYHFKGAHPANFLTEKATWNNDGVGRAEACRGYFYIIETYIQQMKDAGVYDDATIIILADHGFRDWKVPNAFSTIVLVKEAGETRESTAICDKRVSQDQFIPTVIKAADSGSTAEFGYTYAQLPEDAFKDGRSIRVWDIVDEKTCHKRFDYGDAWDLAIDLKDYDGLVFTNGGFYGGEE